ncbi:MAG TPA: hypothetical protein VH479_09240, partial [Acidimicrobiales bacterium]
MTGRSGSRQPPASSSRSRRSATAKGTDSRARRSTGTKTTTSARRRAPSVTASARRSAGTSATTSARRRAPSAKAKGKGPSRRSDANAPRRGAARARGAGGGARTTRSADPRRRALGLLVMVIVMFSVAVLRLGYVQVVGSGRYVAYGEEQRIQPIELAGGRGSIYDREGNDLAISIPQTTIAADPSVIADPAAAAPLLATALGQDPATVLAALKTDGRFVYLARQVPDDVADRVRALHIDGVLLYQEQARFNPAGDMGRALLG